MSAIIRCAKVDDLHKLSLYERQLYGADGYPQLLFYQAFRQWPQLLLVSQSENDVSGYSMMTPLDSERVMLMSLLVATHFQQMGLGRALLNRSLEVAREQGFSVMELSVAPDNTKAIALYNKSEFATVEHITDYLGEGEHRLILRRQLTA